MMRAFFTWSGTGSAPFASSYRLTSSRSPGPELACHDLHDQSHATLVIGSSVHQAECLQASKPLFPAFLTIFHEETTASLQTAVRAVPSPSPLSLTVRMSGIKCASVSVEGKVPVIKVFAPTVISSGRCLKRLSHRSHCFCESCHGRVR